MALERTNVFKGISGAFVMFRTIIKIMEFTYNWSMWDSLDNKYCNTVKTETSWAGYTYSGVTHLNVVRGLSIAKNVVDITTKPLLSSCTIAVHSIGLGLDQFAPEKSLGAFWGSILHYGPELLMLPIGGNIYSFMTLAAKKQDLLHALNAIKSTALPIALFISVSGMQTAKEAYKKECKMQREEDATKQHSQQIEFILIDDSKTVGDTPQNHSADEL
jgi:hypothetical protein